MPSKRSIALDVAKGVAIILVVYGHALRGLISAGMIAPDAGIVMSDYIIYTFHMPLFFFISGLLFNSKRGSEKSREFWWRRAKTIAYPYFLWSLIQGGLQVVLSNSAATNGSMSINALGDILWRPISPFWFLYALFFCHTIWFGIRGRGRADLVGGCSLIVFVVMYLTKAPHTLQDIAYGFLYFSMGIWGAEVSLWQRLPTDWKVSSVLFLVGMALATCSYALEVPERLSFVSAVSMLAAVLTLSRAAETKAPRSRLTQFLALCGQCSMGIFTMHILALGCVRLVAVRVADIHNSLALLPVLVTVAVLIPLGIQLVAIRLNIQEIAGLPSSAKAADRFWPAR